MTLRKSGALFALLATLVAVAGVAAGTATTAAKDPIVIGWAYDTTGSMAPFDVSANCFSLILKASSMTLTIARQRSALWTGSSPRNSSIVRPSQAPFL